MAASIVLICLLAVGISAAPYAMGLILKDEDAFALGVSLSDRSIPYSVLLGLGHDPASIGSRWSSRGSPSGGAHNGGQHLD